MGAQANSHRIIDKLLPHYDGDHDVGVDFSHVDMDILNVCIALQTQVEELAVRLYRAELEIKNLSKIEGE